MAEMRKGRLRIVEYRRDPVWCSKGKGPHCTRGLRGRHRSNRGLWGQNHHLQRLDPTGHPARSAPALCTDSAPSSYLSFVTGAILWDRGLYHHTDSSLPDGPPSLCHRFLTHMNASPGDLRPPRFLSGYPRPMVPQLGQAQRRQAQSAPRIHRYADPRGGLKFWRSKRLQGDSGNLCMPSSPAPTRDFNTPPATPPPSPNTTRPCKETTSSSPTQPPALPPPPLPELEPPRTAALREEDGDGSDESFPAPSADPSSPGSDQRPGSEFKEMVTLVTPDQDLSDFSRPPSSQFSRNSDPFSRQSSALSGMSELGSDRSVLSHLRSSSFLQSALAPSLSPLDPLPQRPPDSPHTLSRSALMLGPGNHSDRHRFSPSWSGWGSLPSDPRGRPTLPGVTPPSIEESRQGQMSRRWPILPPIAPLRGDSEVGESLSSEASCTESDVFEELDAIAPRTGSRESQERPESSHFGCSSPDTVLSQRASSLVLGCGSGDLESLSRVRLLLLNHPGDVGPPSPGPGWGSPSGHGSGHQTEDTGSEEGSGEGHCLTGGAEGQHSHTVAYSEGRASQLSLKFSGSFLSDRDPAMAAEGCFSVQSIDREESEQTCNTPIAYLSRDIERSIASSVAMAAAGPEDSGNREEAPGRRRPSALECLLQEKKRKGEEKKTKVLHIYSMLQESGTPHSLPSSHNNPSKFESFEFLAKYCIFSPEKLELYRGAFEMMDTDGDGYLTCLQVLLALKEIVPPEVLSDSEEIYVYRILEMVDFRVTEGLTDLRLFTVVASLAQKIASLDDFMRSLIGEMDFRSVEMKLYRAKQLFLFLLETQAGTSPAQEGFLSAEHLLVELRAGGIRPEHEEVVERELRHIRSLDLLDFLAHLPLFLLIHSSVIANPLDDTRSL